MSTNNQSKFAAIGNMCKWQLILSLLLLVSLSFTGTVLAALPENAGSPEHAAAKFVENELFVKFKLGKSRPDEHRKINEQNAQHVKTFHRIGVHLVKIPPGLTVEKAMKRFKDDPEVEYAEPNYIFTVNATHNDTHYSKLWGMNNTGQSANGYAGTADADMDLPEAWNITTSSRAITVAVIDTGIKKTMGILQQTSGAIQARQPPTQPTTTTTVI